MRVVHVVPAVFGLGGVFGGAERYVLELARHMAQRVDTRLIAFGEPGRDRDGDLEVQRIRSWWNVGGSPQNPVSPRLLWELRDADVIHCHQHHILASSLSGLWGRLTRRPAFVTDLGGGGWDISAYVATDGWYRGHLHISEYSRRVAGHGQLDCARVIYGGVDSMRFSPQHTRSNRPRRALFVGRLLPHKGIDQLIRGLPPGVGLDVAGRPFEDRYWGKLQSLANGRDVRFLTSLDDGALVDHYRSASCIVLPSVYRDCYGQETRVPELLGQTLLEGMACGLPAICTGVASMPEIVVDGVTGFVVPPNDPEALGERLAWIASNPEAAMRMGEAGRHRVLERFTWGETVDRCLDAYRSLG